MKKDKEVIFVEMLLRNYSAMKAERFNLNIKWNLQDRHINNAIEGEFLKSYYIKDMPGLPSGSYTEHKPLISQDDEVKMLKDEQTFITQRIKDLEDIITIIDSSLCSLTTQDMQIITGFYIERKSLKQVGDSVYLAPEYVSEKKVHILKYMYKSLKVANSQYFLNYILIFNKKTAV